MKLTQYCDYRWEHNEHIRQMQELKIKQAMKSQGYNIEQIDNVIAQKNNEMIIGEVEKPDFSANSAEGGEEFSTGYSSMPTEPEIDLGLTEEDITYLRLK